MSSRRRRSWRQSRSGPSRSDATIPGVAVYLRFDPSTERTIEAISALSGLSKREQVMRWVVSGMEAQRRAPGFPDRMSAYEQARRNLSDVIAS